MRWGKVSMWWSRAEALVHRSHTRIEPLCFLVSAQMKTGATSFLPLHGRGGTMGAGALGVGFCGK